MNARKRLFGLSRLWLYPVFLAISSMAMAATPGRVEEVAPGVWRLRLGQPETLVPMHFQEHAPRLKEMAALEPCKRLPIKVSAIGFKTSGRGSALELPLEPGEQLYGLGMNLKVFQLMDGKKTIRVSDDQGTVLGDSHAPVPFYVSTRGYGIYVDTARYASFYFGNLDAVRNAPVAPRPATGEKAATSTGELYRPRESGAKFVGVDIPSAKGVDVYIFAGPDMRHAVQRYNLFSGGGCLPPMWGLGVWYRASTELGQKEVLNFLQEFRQRHIPCDVFGLEPGWHSHAYSCSFVWSQRYADPERLLRETRAARLQAEPLGTRLHPSEFAALQTASSLERRLQGVGRPGARFRHPRGTADLRRLPCQDARREGRQRLQARRVRPPAAQRHSLVIPGAVGFSVRPGRRTDAPPHRPALPAPMAAMYRDRNQRTLGLVRASGALAAPLPFGLYSDAYDHRDYVRAIATSGFGGILWCPEVRDMGSLEELYRRLQTSVFSAVTQVDCWYLKNPVWKQINKDLNNSGTFMDHWEQTEAACRKLLQMRMRLLPYLYSAYAEYHDTGVPPCGRWSWTIPKTRQPGPWMTSTAWSILDGRAAVHGAEETRGLSARGRLVRLLDPAQVCRRLQDRNRETGGRNPGLRQG